MPMFTQGRSLTALATALFVGLFLLCFTYVYNAKTHLSNLGDPRTRPVLSPPPPPTCTNRAPDDAIPNQVHFVYILKDTSHDFNFEFSHFLSIYAAWHYWRPQAIYLHTNVAADSPSVARARNGTAGKWNHYIFTLFNLTVNEVDVPTHAGNGVELQNIEHKSDFVRVKALYELGGVYIDFDVHPLRDIRPLRESGFKAIAGRQLGGQVNSGTFMTARGGKLVKLWMEQMHVAYTGGWTTHSNEVITRVGQRLVREPGEMLIMERDAFAPGSWKDADTDALFAVHDDTPSNLPPNDTTTTTSSSSSSSTDTDQGGMQLPSHDEAFADRWDHPERFPDWERDWSHTYLLHAFTPDRWQHKVPGFDHITPRYVLERRSNFARAVYPVAKVLFDQGLISVEDSHTGLSS